MEKELSHSVNCSCDSELVGLMERMYNRVRPRASSKSCWRALKWLERSQPPSSAEEVYESILGSYVSTEEFQQSLKQISLDVKRTFPDEAYFGTETGQEALRRVLMAYCKYDISIGYVQGMNFIAASLLWHASEVDAFWLLVTLMEDHEVRDIFLPRLPGISKHCQIIQLLIFEAMPDLSRKFAEFRVPYEMFAGEWCISLFGSVVPVDEMVNVLDVFFLEGWRFFYKFVVVILDCLRERLMESTDELEFLRNLKICKNSQKEWKDFMKNLKNRGSKANWENLIDRANRISVDERYIEYLHKNFNVDTAQFAIQRS